MSVVAQLQTTAGQVEGVREGLDRLRNVLEQSESVLTVADEVLGIADEMLVQAADVVEKSKRWAPKAAIVLGVVAAAGVAAFVIMRVRRRDED
jgi:ATP:corrinoid adenosyltransferase